MDYYKIMQIDKKASAYQIKQAYKKLALLYHPDKNQNKDAAKNKFMQISEAYTVLSDDCKRQKYDLYGIREQDNSNEFEFENFMSDFTIFEQFLDDFEAFDEIMGLNNIFENMFKVKEKKAKTGSKRSNKMMHEVMRQLMKMDVGRDEEEEEEEDSSDQGSELNVEEMQIYEYGLIYTEKIKNKKNMVKCKLDGNKFEEDQILMHFSQNHLLDFKKWQSEQKV